MKRRQFVAGATGALALITHANNSLAKTFSAKLPAQITDLDASELSLAIRMKLLSCEEVMAAYLKHIHRYNPTYNAIVALRDDSTLLSEARHADEELAKGMYRGWMHGMPHAIKDLEAVANMPVTYGSPLFRDNVAKEDDPLPASIRRAGAIFIGKTNTPEFGLGSQSYNPIYGVTGSAWNPDLTAGGSSGGAACGLGTHMLPVADGSDMMGSLRNPGAFNNVIGFRPSAGLTGSSSPFSRDLATTGPMGRNTRDTVRLLNTIMPKPGVDAPQALWAAAKRVSAPQRLNLKGLKIAWLGDLGGYLAMEPGVISLCEAAVATVADAGAIVESVTPQFAMAELWDCWVTLRNLSRLDMRAWYEDPTKRPLLKPELQWEIERSYDLSTADVRGARNTQLRWYQELQRLFASYDFLMLPSAQVFPFDKNVHWPASVGGRAMDTYHRWMEVVIPGSIPGLPVVNVPAGFDPQNRPMGLQVMGQYGADDKVLGFATAYENLTDFLTRRPVLVEHS